jgi:hypothetical protein
VHQLVKKLLIIIEMHGMYVTKKVHVAVHIVSVPVLLAYLIRVSY